MIQLLFFFSLINGKMMNLGILVIFTHADQKGFKTVCDVSLASNRENKYFNIRVLVPIFYNYN